MKKITIFAAALMCCFSSFAQTSDSPLVDREMLRLILQTCSVLLALLIIATFLLTIIKNLLDYRIKHKLIDKGLPEEVITQFLRPPSDESQYAPVKWFTTLTGIGIGLLLVNYTQPMGLHSLAIMSFSIAAGFLGYYLFIRKNQQ